jgi:hypothetical protein
MTTPFGAETATSAPTALSGIGTAETKPAKMARVPMKGAKINIVE